MGEMPKLVIRTTVYLLTLSLFAPALAADTRWYRVEMLVVAQPGGGQEENWPTHPELSYPRQSQFLRTPAEQLAISGSNADLPASPRPLTLLPASSREFKGTSYMRSRGGYRILFHEAWAQPLGSGADESALVLDRSGDRDQWSELQGTVRLSLSRYLHLETNLWLNTNAPYFPEGWKMVPPPPLGPSSTSGETGTTTSPAQVDVYDHYGKVSDSTDVSIDGSRYPFRHAILMQQKKRMRSNEIHYLDHPALGLVIKLTPLSAAQLATIADMTQSP